MSDVAAITLGLVTGVVSSLVASTLYLLAYAHFLRPAIEVSPYIAMSKRDGELGYAFKIVNRSRYPAVNIQFRVSVTRPISVPDGTVYVNTPVNLLSDSVFELEKFNRNDKEARYAWRIRTTDNIEELWDEANGGYVTFRVLATHSLSGLSKAYTHRFYGKSDRLRPGEHRWGPELDVS